MMRLPVKKIFGKIHLWLGLIAGLVVFVSLTAAALFVWDEELTDWYHKDKRFVQAVKAERLPFHILLENARKAARDNRVTYVTISREPSRAYALTGKKPASAYSRLERKNRMRYQHSSGSPPALPAGMNLTAMPIIQRHEDCISLPLMIR